MVSDTVTECAGTGCAFQEQTTETTFKVTPKKGTQGADFVASTNLSGIRISCDFAPFSYPDNRQPNTIWYTYDDGSAASTKTNTIVIEKAYVQITPENGSSKYRICYTSPVRFKDRTGAMAPADPVAGWAERLLRWDLVHRSSARLWKQACRTVLARLHWSWLG